MPTTRILLRLAEPSGVQPSDAMGNLGDLAVPSGLSAPGVAETWTGRGRAFSATGFPGFPTGLVAVDRPGRDTLLQRDVTIQAIITFGASGGSAQALIVGGLDDGTAAEQPDYGLQLRDAGANVEASWLHATPGGGDVVTSPPGVFQAPAAGRFFLFTATRRWESTSLVVVRFYVGPELVAELDWAAGAIGGGTTGHTSVGARKSGGAWGSHWNGIIDELLVADWEMSAEEIRHTWRRLVEYQPAGVAMFAGLAPPGLPWYENPSNHFGRRVKVSGQALGTGIAAAEELRALWLPDAAPLSHIPKWERLCGLTPRPRDSLDVRRRRVASYFAREEGFSHPAIKAAFEEVFDLPSDDIELLEFSNEIRDPFDELAEERWLSTPTAEWSAISGVLRLLVAAGQDLAAAPLPSRHVRMSLERGGGRLFVSAKISSTFLPTGAGAGIFICNRVSNDYLWFGVYNSAGTAKVAWRKRVAAVTSPVTFLANAPGIPLWLRLYTPMEHGTQLGASGRFTAAWSGTGPSSDGFVTADLGATGVTDSEWGGLAAIGGVVAGPFDLLLVDFDDFLAFCPDGDRSFCWYAYRNPALPGNADMVGARALAGKVKPAHTHAAAIRSRSVLCDDPDLGLTDTGPMGAL